ncbi:MAG: asparagine synthase (glutamine-hydrolyzing) [Alphaproteobacteria bacterium]
MCGVAGILSANVGIPAAELNATVSDMSDTLAHRGPDDSGVWTDPAAGIGLGHRRLSIIDTSSAGRQPMVSASGRYVISYNGEIYNFADLRADLSAKGVSFSGGSDTEVVLAAIERWGLPEALQKFIGMCAFAVWDRERRELTLARDRLGIKPLYYGRLRNGIVFGSELKALREHPEFECDTDPDSAALMLQYGYIPAPHTIFRNASKLPPGHILTVSNGDTGTLRSRAFWSAKDAVARAQKTPFDGDENSAVDALENLLGDAVARRMVSDVPLGALLSGGLDSSTVVALMQARSDRPVKTFSVGFDEQAYDESRFAAEIAHTLGTDHTELRLSAAEALNVVPNLATMYDEPFGDSSQIPTHLISRLARRDVTVALTGDGGDELFAGYRRYGLAQTCWGMAGRFPGFVRKSAGAALTAPPENFWDGVFRIARLALPAGLRKPDTGSRLNALGTAISADNEHELYHRLMTFWPDARAAIPGSVAVPTLLSDPSDMPGTRNIIERATYIDLMTYLPDDILTKVDRASMAVGLELRVPLLDHRVVEFAASLPMGMKRRDGQSKWILRKLCEKYLPAGHFDRPKTGFSIPLADWLRGPLRDWAEDLLSEKRLQETALLEPGAVRRKWTEHVTGKGNRAPALWNVLMLQQWLTETGRGVAKQ